MSNSNDVKEFLTAMGSLAEMCIFFRTKLEANGFSRSEAMELTKTYLTATLTNNKTK